MAFNPLDVPLEFDSSFPIHPPLLFPSSYSSFLLSFLVFCWLTKSDVLPPQSGTDSYFARPVDPIGVSSRRISAPIELPVSKVSHVMISSRVNVAAVASDDCGKPLSSALLWRYIHRFHLLCNKKNSSVNLVLKLWVWRHLMKY